MSQIMEGTIASYNKATGWLSITFPSKPSDSILGELRANGFHYKSYSKRWNAPFTVEREECLKRIAGTIEQVDIAPNYEAKAEFSEIQANNHLAKSEELHQRAATLASLIPFGQPILVGHHSERRHRNDLEKIHRNFGKAIEEREIAETYQDRAKRYEDLAKNGENPFTIHNRIKKLEADERQFKRWIEEAELAKNPELAQEYGDALKNLPWAERMLKHTQERLEVEQAKYKATSGIPTDSLELKVGDRVKTQFGKATITKVNKKTVSVDFAEVHLGHFHNLDKTCILGKVSE